MSRVIAPAEIRRGDRVRIVAAGPESAMRGPDGCRGLLAVEFVAVSDCDTAGFSVGHAGRYEREVVLLDRPVAVPTRPYSLVIPPADERAAMTAYVLEPDPDTHDDESRWYQYGHVVEAAEIEAALVCGWVAIDGPEVLP